jgi:hypothetical protein
MTTIRFEFITGVMDGPVPLLEVVDQRTREAGMANNVDNAFIVLIP